MSKRKHKTPAHDLAQAKARRDAIKAAGGAEYEALLAKERAARALYRERHPDYWRESRKTAPFKTYLCAGARARGRKSGLEATINPGDLHWPTHCPILGIELDYPARSGSRGTGRAGDNWPSLDRWDNAKGYVRGNVYVISYRANVLKSNANPEELEAVARYARHGLAGALPLFGKT